MATLLNRFQKKTVVQYSFFLVPNLMNRSVLCSAFSQWNEFFSRHSVSVINKRKFNSLSEEAVKAIADLKETIKKPEKKKKNITRETLKNCKGHKLRFMLIGDKEEFHHIDRDKNDLIIEPTDSFRAVITSSKNNVHIQVLNKSKRFKTVFGSFAGNVGFSKTLQQTERCAYRIGENIAKKCKRLGIFSLDIKFRRIMRVETVLQAMYANNLNITKIIHEPRLPKCGINASKPRKRRRV